MKRGTATVKVRSLPCLWTPGAVFLANPFEVHEGTSLDELLDYEVFYPSIELVLEAIGMQRSAGALPRFSHPVLVDARVVEELSAILSDSAESSNGMSRANAAIEESLIRFFRRNTGLLDFSMDRNAVASVQRACRIMQETLDLSISLPDLAAQVGVSRYYFIRLFHTVTGLAPNAYLRQLRLAKARRLICQGGSLAEVAMESGFADQAHLTREFKRVFGVTPGAISRDLETCVAAS